MGRGKGGGHMHQRRGPGGPLTPPLPPSDPPTHPGVHTHTAHGLRQATPGGIIAPKSHPERGTAGGRTRTSPHTDARALTMRAHGLIWARPRARHAQGPGDLHAFTHVMERERATHRQVSGGEGARSCPRHTSSHSLATRGVNCMRAPSTLHVTGEAGGEDGRNWCSARNGSSGEDEPPLADPLTQTPDPAVPFVFPPTWKALPIFTGCEGPTHPPGLSYCSGTVNPESHSDPLFARRGVNCMRAPSTLHVTGEAGGEDGRN